MAIWAASKNAAKRFVIGDSLEPIAELLRAIINEPEKTAQQYAAIWAGQKPDNLDYFNSIRARYNAERAPVDLLYLICRCVKNAVRFNKTGAFTQSVDKRRLGMRPDKMTSAITGVSLLLKNRVEIRTGDWLDTTQDASRSDFIYMDPPYLGTSVGPDKRYAHQMLQDRLIEGLESFRKRQLRFALSYDGMTGEKEYGPALPESLGLTRLLLHAGVSSQATLHGRKAETIESLYVSPGLAHHITKDIIRKPRQFQEALDF
jgi:DNA adenine methylase